MMRTLLILAIAITAGRAYAASHPATEAEHGMVVTSQHLASDIGADILRRGGNAMDAAVAIGYAEAVTNACCGNIGGGGFMVVHTADGRDSFLNFRETAPAAATRDMYLDAQGAPVPGASLLGWLAPGVPGTVLGLDKALQEYGTMTRTQVMAPAIALARDGFVLTRADTDIIDAGAARLRGDKTAAAIFLRPDGAGLRPGDRLVQTDLAHTLEAIAQHGPDAFYHGAVADRVAAAAKAGGGIITAADFANYTVTEGAPITCTYRGYTIVSAPPPSSGGVAMCEILNILEGYDMRALGFHSAQGVHDMVEAMRHAYMDRNTYLGDPAFIHNPVARLTSKDYAAQIRAAIMPDRATPSRNVQPGTPPHEQTETTHYSVVDGGGNAVSVTYTVNGLFGAGVMAPGTGFFMNDEMDDFTIKPGVPNMFGLIQGQANAIAPGKRPLSSMAPSLVTKDGGITAVVGSPGGSRIITITLETIMNLIDYDMQPQEAVDAPRIHHHMFGLIQGQANAIAPGKRPLSSMAPSLVTKDGGITAVVGSPGGSRIITITLETIMNLIDYEMQPQEAVDAPRIHHQWLPDEVDVEPYALSPDTKAILQAMGYKIVEQRPWGAAELVALLPKAGIGGAAASSGNDSTVGGMMLPGHVYGANDNRRPAGSAVGSAP